MTAALALDGVTKRYGVGAQAVVAMDDVTLEVATGELLAVVGPSGSGKSTLMDVAGGLHRPTSGTVRVDDVDLGALRDPQMAALRAHRVGFVFQQFHLIASLTAVDNVAMGLLYHGLNRRERRERACGALDAVGLVHRADHRPTELSGGERQRVAVARALVKDPAVILADEPTGNLDSATGGAIVNLLLDLHDRGRTLVVITHDHSLAGRLPRVVRMRDGRIW